MSRFFSVNFHGLASYPTANSLQQQYKKTACSPVVKSQELETASRICALTGRSPTNSSSSSKAEGEGKVNSCRSMLQIAARLHCSAIWLWGTVVGKWRRGEEGCYWCSACKGMPVTPPRALSNTLVRDALPHPLPLSRQTGQALMHH